MYETGGEGVSPSTLLDGAHGRDEAVLVRRRELAEHGGDVVLRSLVERRESHPALAPSATTGFGVGRPGKVF